MRTIGLRSDHPPDQIPASHRDLVQCPPVAALTTVMADGSPQTSVVWCDFDGLCCVGREVVRAVRLRP
jgi:predicted pyridoxine 5'-phosphate oxidase superfamily flavin-nucleotide-binding protein